MASAPVVTEIVTQIADRESVHPVDLDPPLHDAIDTDALGELTDGSWPRQYGSFPRVEFLYCGYLVTVDRTGRIIVDDPTDAIAESSSEPAKRSLENLAAELDHREAALSRAAALMTTHDRPFGEQVTDLLELGRETLGMEYATLSYVDADTYVFEAVDTPADSTLQAGETAPLAELPNCKQVVETEGSLVLRDIETEAPELVDATWGISAYIGMPVFVDGEIYGTFCFYGMEARSEAFSDWDRTFVDLLSTWVSGELDRRRRDRALHTRTSDHPMV